MEIEEFVKQFAAQFDETGADEFSPKTKFRDLGEWNSLVALSVMAMVGDTYGVRLTAEDMRNSESIEDIFEKVNSKLDQKA